MNAKLQLIALAESRKTSGAAMEIDSGNQGTINLLEEIYSSIKSTKALLTTLSMEASMSSSSSMQMSNRLKHVWSSSLPAVIQKLRFAFTISHLSTKARTAATLLSILLRPMNAEP